MSIAERWQGFRPLPADIHDRVQRLPGLLERKGVRLAYLFGSLAGAERADRQPQDVDLGLLMQPDVPAYHLQEPISQALGTMRVDIVDLALASPVLRFHIIRSGTILYAADKDIRLDFELDTVREYQDTQWLRRRQRELLKERLAPWLSAVTSSNNA